MKSYEDGRHVVFDGAGNAIGRIDFDEFIRDSQARLMYRIDGDEVYSMDGDFLGNLISGVLQIDGRVIFRIAEE
jgi:hypothetical protein